MMQPSVPRDHSIMVNLAELVERTFPKIDSSHLASWVSEHCCQLACTIAYNCCRLMLIMLARYRFGC